MQNFVRIDPTQAVGHHRQKHKNLDLEGITPPPPIEAVPEIVGALLYLVKRTLLGLDDLVCLIFLF